MRRVVLWSAATAAVLILLISYPTSRPARHPATAPPGVRPTGPRPGGDLRVNGPAVDTVWGPLQVQAVLSGGRLVDVVVLVAPSGSAHDRAINDAALPRLREQALAAQSADIAGVSGATVTSDGYRRSLQGALDAAATGTSTGVDASPGAPTVTPPTGPTNTEPTAIEPGDD